MMEPGGNLLRQHHLPVPYLFLDDRSFGSHGTVHRALQQGGQAVRWTKSADYPFGRMKRKQIINTKR